MSHPLLCPHCGKNIETSQLATGNLRGLRVLVVDDSATTLQVVQDALESAGCIVFTSVDIWVSSLIIKMRPDIILMDVNMGSLSNGPTIVKSIKKRELSKDIPIFLFSTEPIPALEKYCLDCGADGYIEKTADTKRLLTDLSKALRTLGSKVRHRLSFAAVVAAVLTHPIPIAMCVYSVSTGIARHNL